MDSIYKIIGIALITCIATLIVNINSSIYGIIFKIIGVGYLVEFTASICSDTGNHSLSDKVLLGGKIIILVMALPIITSILEIVMDLLPS